MLIKTKKKKLEAEIEKINKKISELQEKIHILEAEKDNIKDNIQKCIICGKNFIATQDNSYCCCVKCYQKFYGFMKVTKKNKIITDRKKRVYKNILISNNKKYVVIFLPCTTEFCEAENHGDYIELVKTNKIKLREVIAHIWYSTGADCFKYSFNPLGKVKYTGYANTLEECRNKVISEIFKLEKAIVIKDLI